MTKNPGHQRKRHPVAVGGTGIRQEGRSQGLGFISTHPSSQPPLFLVMTSFLALAVTPEFYHHQDRPSLRGAGFCLVSLPLPRANLPGPDKTISSTWASRPRDVNYLLPWVTSGMSHQTDGLLSSSNTWSLGYFPFVGNCLKWFLFPGNTGIDSITYLLCILGTPLLKLLLAFPLSRWEKAQRD